LAHTTPPWQIALSRFGKAMNSATRMIGEPARNQKANDKIRPAAGAETGRLGRASSVGILEHKMRKTDAKCAKNG
jgi:hypothetical protein